MASLEFKIRELTVIHKLTQNVKGLYIHHVFTTEENTLYFIFQHHIVLYINIYINYFFNDNNEEYYINIFDKREFITTYTTYDINSVIEFLNDFFNEHYLNI